MAVYAVLEIWIAIAVPADGARGTRLCYKEGSRAARAQCARVSRVASAHSCVRADLPADSQHAARISLFLAVRSHPRPSSRYATSNKIYNILSEYNF